VIISLEGYVEVPNHFMVKFLRYSCNGAKNIAQSRTCPDSLHICIFKMCLFKEEKEKKRTFQLFVSIETWLCKERLGWQDESNAFAPLRLREVCECGDETNG